MLNCSVRPWNVRATRTKREIWKSGDPGHLERCGVCVVSTVGPSGDPARASSLHPLPPVPTVPGVLCPSVCLPAPTPGLSGPIKHQQHVFSPSLSPLAPGSLSFLPVLHCFSILSAVSSLSSLLVRVSFVHHPLSKGSMYPALWPHHDFLVNL